MLIKPSRLADCLWLGCDYKVVKAKRSRVCYKETVLQTLIHPLKCCPKLVVCCQGCHDMLWRKTVVSLYYEMKIPLQLVTTSSMYLRRGRLLFPCQKLFVSLMHYALRIMAKHNQRVCIIQCRWYTTVITEIRSEKVKMTAAAFDHWW